MFISDSRGTKLSLLRSDVSRMKASQTSGAAGIVEDMPVLTSAKNDDVYCRQFRAV